jgi:tRNA uridine 5-carbamoylmethylation protein Kti12
MKKLILVAGPAGIGKSTYCQSYIKDHPEENVKIVSSDEIRRKITKSYRAFPTDKNGVKDMSPVYNGMVQAARAINEINTNVTVLLDTTMLYDDKRLFFLNHLPHFDEVDLYLLKLHNYDLCFIRNKQRIPEKWVPDSVIANMIKDYQDPAPDVAKRFHEVKTIYLD